MKRRDFITLFGGGAAVWPLVARAQADRARRIGLLVGWPETDTPRQANISAFRDGLAKLGWIEGRNITIEYHWTDADPNGVRDLVVGLVRRAPDVIWTTHTPLVQALRDATGTIPIVFASLSDPVDAGVVSSLSHPGANITGYSGFEFSLAGKWLGLLREVAPRILRATVMFNPQAAPFAPNYWRAAAEAARPHGIEVITAGVRNAQDIEKAIAAIADGDGLIVLPDIFTNANGALICALANRHHVPGIYPAKFYATAGGLLTYGPDVLDIFRRSATYVDRILRGEKAGDLPVVQPTKFEFVINLKTAKALGIEVPSGLLAIADEVIE